jgi:hypothetical protein
VLQLCHHTHAPACHCLPLVSPKHSKDSEEESGALNGPEHFSQESHYIHDEMMDASPGPPHPNDIHDLEDDVSIIPNTKELFEEQDEKENVEARSKIMLLSPIEEVFQVWKHLDVTLWSPLQDIMWTPVPSNQYLLPVTQLVPYTQQAQSHEVQSHVALFVLHFIFCFVKASR